METVVLGLGGIEKDSLLSFLIVAKRNLASSGTGNGDSPQQALNVPKPPLGQRQMSAVSHRRGQQEPSL